MMMGSGKLYVTEAFCLGTKQYRHPLCFARKVPCRKQVWFIQGRPLSVDLEPRVGGIGVASFLYLVCFGFLPAVDAISSLSSQRAPKGDPTRV